MPSILRAGRPTEQRLLASLAGVRGEALTYEGVGCSLGLARPDPGLEVRTWWTNLPAGSWERAAGALDAWAAHRGAGFLVVPGGPPAVGVEVAVGVPLVAGHLVATCRIVATVDEPDRVGFAYGTLPLHPERGEESFVIERGGDEVRFVVTAVSAPAHLLARMAGPVASLLQGRATGRYLNGMRSWVSR